MTTNANGCQKLLALRLEKLATKNATRPEIKSDCHEVINFCHI